MILSIIVDYKYLRLSEVMHDSVCLEIITEVN